MGRSAPCLAGYASENLCAAQRNRMIYLIDRAGKILFRQAYGLEEQPGLRTVLDVLGGLS